MRSLIQSTPAYQLSLEVSPTTYGYNFRLLSFVPTARRPDDHVQFQGLFSVEELTRLRNIIDQALEER